MLPRFLTSLALVLGSAVVLASPGHGKRYMQADDPDSWEYSEELMPYRELLPAFKQFMGRHGKSYRSYEEYRTRFSIFRDNVRKAEELQQQDTGTATYGVTKFSDLTDDEFQSSYCGALPDLESKELQPTPVIEDLALPKEFDWRHHNAVTPVKNQSGCGSCWAFATTGNLEGQWAIKHKELISLSEQQLIDCDSSNNGCRGGNVFKAINFLNANGGIMTEEDYKYTAHKDNCRFDRAKAKVQVWGSQIFVNADEDDLAFNLRKIGPLAVQINPAPLKQCTGGVIRLDRSQCDPANTNHSVLLVGYGEAKIKCNDIDTDEVLPYWIIKNSWGDDVGEEGYHRVYRGEGTCGINLYVYSAFIPGNTVQ